MLAVVAGISLVVLAVAVDAEDVELRRLGV